MLDYLAETQKASLAHVDRLVPYSANERLAIDPATRRSLELTATIRDGGRAGSLLGVMDRTVTSLGARLLADWLAAPLVDVPAINARLDAVGRARRRSDAHRQPARSARTDLRHPAALGPRHHRPRQPARS